MNKLKIYLIFFISILVTLGCSKKTEIIDFSDINLIALTPKDLTINNITLQGEIKKLNDIPVIEYGYILKKRNTYPRLDEEIIIKADSKIKTGLVQYKYKSDVPFELDGQYSIAIYVKTELGYYKSDFLDFTIDQFEVNPTSNIQATIGQKIEVKGDFRFLTKDHQLVPGDKFNNFTIPYSLSEDKQTLTFIIPNNKEFNHGRNEVFSIKSLNKSNWQYKYRNLIEIRILGHIQPPEKTILNNDVPLILRGFALNNFSSQSNPPFYLLFNGKRIPYKEYIYRDDIDLPGDSFSFGYVNGRDSVIFNQSIKWNNVR